MVWKKVNNADAGDADHFGGDDMDKVSDLFSGVDVDTVDINSTTKFRKNKLRLANTANSFYTTFNSGDVSANRVIDLPTGGDTTLLGTDSTQTVTNKTINSADNTITGTTNTDGNYLRANGTKFVSAPISYYDVPRAVFTNTNDIFFRNRNSANDTNPIASYSLWTNGFSPHIGYIQTEDILENFDTDGWVDTGVITGVDAGVLKITAKADNTNIGSSFDAGAGTISNSTWTLRFRVRVTSNTVSGDGGAVYFGVSDLPSTTGQSTNQDFIGLYIKTDAGVISGNQTYTVHSAEADGSAIQTTGDSSFNFTFNTNEWYFWEINRTSTTNFTIKCYGKDPTFGKQIGSSFSITCASTNQNHRYLKVCNTVTTATGERDYEFDGIRMWKTVTVGSLTRATPQLACNSTVNNTSYYMSQTIPYYPEPPQLIVGPAQAYVVEDFTRYQNQEEADYFWETQDTVNARVNISTDSLNCVVLKDGTNDSILLNYPSLSTATTISSTSWELRFKATMTGRSATTSSQAQAFVGLFNASGSSGGNVAQKFIGWAFNANSTNQYWNVGRDENVVLNETLTTGTVMGTSPLYFRLTRVNDTTMSYGVYSDSNFTQLVTQSTFGITTTTITNDISWLGVKNNNSATTADSTFNLKIENMTLINATSATYNPPVSGNTTFGGTVPIDPIAWAINFNKNRTTETQFKIRISRSTQPFFTDSDNVRVIDVVDYTDQVYRYTPQNKVYPILENDPFGVYWVQLMGTTNNSQLAVNAIRYMIYDNTAGTPTGVKMLNTHMHYLFKKTAVDNQLDAN